MKEENILMRILFCNIHGPILCFCKPSAAARLYAAASVSSGSSAGPLPPPPPPQTSPCRVVSVSDGWDQSFDDANDSNDTGLKSCIKEKREKKAPADAAAEEETEEKKVQWVDDVGQQLAEILEFESSECGDIDYEEENQSGCVCTIL